ncbi:MAG: ComF family protein [Chitinophagaceae bacterium]
MFSILQQYTEPLVHLFFPHYCVGCSTDVIAKTHWLCSRCVQSLPGTNFVHTAQNPVEIPLAARMPIEAAAAAYYFTRKGILHNAIMQLKYHNYPEVGVYLGKLLGEQLLQSERFQQVEALVPLPLNAKKQALRGYNQAAKIAEGIAAVWPKPILTQAVARRQFTKTQTKENRVNRWENMQAVFEIVDEAAITGKHILLVDDVITTGATIESCGRTILAIPNTKLSIVAVGYTSSH